MLTKTEAAAAPDFIALAQAGVELHTRDRRAVGAITVDEAAGILRGHIAVEGPLSWRRDGSFIGAPAGISGPLDLAPPAQGKQPAPQRASLQAALNDADEAKSRAPFCCD